MTPPMTYLLMNPTTTSGMSGKVSSMTFSPGLMTLLNISLEIHIDKAYGLDRNGRPYDNIRYKFNVDGDIDVRSSYSLGHRIRTVLILTTPPSSKVSQRRDNSEREVHHFGFFLLILKRFALTRLLSSLTYLPLEF